MFSLPGICYSAVMEITPLQGNEIGALASAVKVLQEGGVVIAPTDTVYGIVGDATRPEALQKIIAMKRAGERPFPVFVRDIATARRYAYISDGKVKFLEKMWPGPITVIFYHKEKLPPLLTAHLDTIGLRIPGHPFLLDLLGRFDAPLVQTSANISGKPPATNCEEIRGYFGESAVAPDLVIDGGELSSRPSAVIDFKGEQPIVVRTGMISPAELQKILEAMA